MIQLLTSLWLSTPVKLTIQLLEIASDTVLKVGIGQEGSHIVWQVINISQSSHSGGMYVCS